MTATLTPSSFTLRGPLARSGGRVTPCVPSQLVIVGELEAPDGRRWSAIGGGATLEEALAFVRASCPAGTNWELTRWEELYGD